jgi:hypothetical protein
MRVVFVLGRQDLLVGPDAETVIHERQARGGVRGETDLLRCATDVAGQRRFDLHERLAFRLRKSGGFEPHGIRVDLPAKELNRLRHGLRMRDQQKAGEMCEIGRERKEPAHRLPVDGAIRMPDRRRAAGGCGLGLSGIGRSTASRRTDGDAASQRTKKLTPVQRHGRSVRPPFPGRTSNVDLRASMSTRI